MGDPKKQRKKYRRPLTIWNKDLIAEQKDLTQEYGLKNKKEIWKTESKLKALHDQAKNLIAKSTPQSEKESEQLLKKLSNLSLIPPAAKLEDVLSLTLKDLLDRRLQTLVFQKGLAKTIKQARQFITHNHVSIADQTLNIPSYLVKSQEESQIRFNPASSLSQETHAERTPDAEAQEKEKRSKEEILEAKPKKEKIAKKTETETKKPAEEKPAELKKEEPKKEEPENKEEPKEIEQEKEKPKKEEIKKVQPEQKKPEELTKEEQLQEAVPEERITHKEK